MFFLYHFLIIIGIYQYIREIIKQALFVLPGTFYNITQKTKSFNQHFPSLIEVKTFCVSAMFKMEEAIEFRNQTCKMDIMSIPKFTGYKKLTKIFKLKIKLQISVHI